jgi:hypothetical protein
MIARTAARLFAALLAAATLGGCTTLSGSPRASSACADALGDVDQLKQLADAAITEENWELAYRYVALMHILHPESERDRDSFALAARLYRLSWAPHRTELDSIWVTSEPRFLIAWLAGFFQPEQPFPQEQMNALFLGMNYGLLREFLAYGQTHPRISRWVITAEKDNGIVEKITGVPAAPAKPAGS